MRVRPEFLFPAPRCGRIRSSIRLRLFVVIWDIFRGFFKSQLLLHRSFASKRGGSIVRPVRGVEKKSCRLFLRGTGELKTLRRPMQAEGWGEGSVFHRNEWIVEDNQHDDDTGIYLCMMSSENPQPQLLKWQSDSFVPPSPKSKKNTLFLTTNY
jgi:hypothetical protein